MTELNIEQERREFERAYGKVEERDPRFVMNFGTDVYFRPDTQRTWNGWLLAKRAALGSAEPVGEVADEYISLGIRVGVARWKDTAPPAGTNLYTAPPAPVSAEPMKFDKNSHVVELLIQIGSVRSSGGIPFLQFKKMTRAERTAAVADVVNDAMECYYDTGAGQ